MTSGIIQNLVGRLWLGDTDMHACARARAHTHNSPTPVNRVRPAGPWMTSWASGAACLAQKALLSSFIIFTLFASSNFPPLPVSPQH